MRIYFITYMIAGLICLAPSFMFVAGINRMLAHGDMIVLTTLGCVFLFFAFAERRSSFLQKRASGKYFEITRGGKEIPFRPHRNCGKGTHAVWYRIGPREDDKKTAGVKCDGTEVYLQG